MNIALFSKPYGFLRLYAGLLLPIHVTPTHRQKAVLPLKLLIHKKFIQILVSMKYDSLSYFFLTTLTTEYWRKFHPFLALVDHCVCIKYARGQNGKINHWAALLLCTYCHTWALGKVLEKWSALWGHTQTTLTEFWGFLVSLHSAHWGGYEVHIPP